MDYANKMINCFVLQCLKFSCYQINRIPDWWCIIINLQSCGLIWFTWRSFPHSATFSISRFIGVSDWGGVIGGCTYPQLNVMKGKTEEKKKEKRLYHVNICLIFLCLTRLNTNYKIFTHNLLVVLNPPAPLTILGSAPVDCLVWSSFLIVQLALLFSWWLFNNYSRYGIWFNLLNCTLASIVWPIQCS